MVRGTSKLRGWGALLMRSSTVNISSQGLIAKFMPTAPSNLGLMYRFLSGIFLSRYLNYRRGRKNKKGSPSGLPHLEKFTDRLPTEF